ncbi:hypothetical protein VN12_19710 [Pirellula sp. SH-Sr6A]|uniref:hypothetical protein n=1 Tax=Pirellula sp. SH-Sr6A TaxID=1632865 RepID=UPI00078D3FB5|nr:hypothetical protein [Pirellula sp. SH-Sr6A]AMV30875.1 hypothetical protein VN12_02080 [Pirellula sp. SH-Sr6A]AMV31299.1 hypothetical protein VN12_04225 [Pirellula sp. SH-Sr6A]AMV34362.1 hypothetical protein VN12_19710 [Pirellula sp. SH-Sr6A]
MITEVHSVTAEYLGQVDLGAPCFAVKIVDIKPNATVHNKVLFRSRVAGSFQIGKNYEVEAVISQESKESPRIYEVLKVA